MDISTQPTNPLPDAHRCVPPAISVTPISCCPTVAPPARKCEVCDNPSYISFNWRCAQENREKRLHALATQLLRHRSLKFGALYICRLCGLNWVLDDAGSTMTRVPNEQMKFLDEWDQCKLSIKPRHLEVLDAIGGTAPNYWMGDNGVISIPCAITMRSGECVDPAIVWITRRAPVNIFSKRIRLFQNIATLAPSRFALPLNVRQTTASAGEVKMGFAPTRVLGPDGKPFILHWATSLFNQYGITGSEIRLSARPFKLDEQIPVADADANHATYFFADWFECADNLNKAHLANSLYSRIWAYISKYTCRIYPRLQV